MNILKKVVRKSCYLLIALGVSGCGPSALAEAELGKLVFDDQFDQSGPLKGYTTHNKTALPSIKAKDGRYYAPVEANPRDITLHFNQSQGRLDAQKVRFPFVVIARNIGIGKLDQPQQAPGSDNEPYLFAGVQVHVLDLDERTSSHVVVGHRGAHMNTVEGKNTIDGHSWVDDVGVNKAPAARADIMIEGSADRKLKVFWQPPNTTPEKSKDRWVPYNNMGELPGDKPAYGEEVYVGLITYAAGKTGLPFAGTADRFQIYQR